MTATTTKPLTTTTVRRELTKVGVQMSERPTRSSFEKRVGLKARTAGAWLHSSNCDKGVEVWVVWVPFVRDNVVAELADLKQALRRTSLAVVREQGNAVLVRWEGR